MSFSAVTPPNLPLLSRIPVTLITGFLGSGKTTLLNHLVQQSELAETLVIINEFGAVCLDHLLVSHVAEDLVVEMGSGCVCCTIRGDLTKVLREAVERKTKAEQARPRFSRIIIETTGLADPVPVLHTLLTDIFLADNYVCDGVVTVVDAVNGDTTLTQHVEAVKQAAVADVLLLTKTDMAHIEQTQRLQARLSELNPGAAQLVVHNGEVAPSRLFDLGLCAVAKKTVQVSEWLNAEAFAVAAERAEGARKQGFKPAQSVEAPSLFSKPAPLRPDVNRHGDDIKAFCFSFPHPVPKALFDQWVLVLMGLLGDNILRIKGLVNLQGHSGPTVIHGVQHVFHPPFEMAQWPDADHSTRIVFITRNVGRGTIEATFNAVATGNVSFVSGGL